MRVILHDPPLEVMEWLRAKSIPMKVIEPIDRSTALEGVDDNDAVQLSEEELAELDKQADAIMSDQFSYFKEEDIAPANSVADCIMKALQAQPLNRNDLMHMVAGLRGDKPCHDCNQMHLTKSFRNQVNKFLRGYLRSGVVECVDKVYKLVSNQ